MPAINLSSFLGGGMQMPGAAPKKKQDFSSWTPVPEPFSKEQLETNSVPQAAKRNKKVVMYGDYLEKIEKEITGLTDDGFSLRDVKNSARSFILSITPRPEQKVLGVESTVRTLPALEPQDVPSIAIVYGTSQTYPTDDTYEIVEGHLRRYLQTGNKLLVCGGCWDLDLLERICKGEVEYPEQPKKKRGEPKPPQLPPVSKEAEGVTDKPGYTAPKWRPEGGDPWSSSRRGPASLSPAGKTFFQEFSKTPASSASFKGTFLNRANAKDTLYADKKGKVAMTFHVTQWGSAVMHIIDVNAEFVDWVAPVLQIWNQGGPGGAKAKKPAPAKKKTDGEEAKKTSSSRGKRNRDGENGEE